MKGLLFLISGPSGVGKGTLIRHLKRKFPHFFYPLSHTTRAIRPGEREGDVYHFESREQFEKGIREGEFLEYAQVHQKAYYGTLKKPIFEALEAGRIVIREVDRQGFHSISAVIPRDNLVTIFLKAESEEKLLERIAKRGALPAEELQRRMESARMEMQDAHLYGYQVWSLEGKLQQCYHDVEAIIRENVNKVGLTI